MVPRKNCHRLLVGVKNQIFWGVRKYQPKRVVLVLRDVMDRGLISDPSIGDNRLKIG